MATKDSGTTNRLWEQEKNYSHFPDHKKTFY